MYGKTIIKPIKTDTIIRDSQNEFDKYGPLNYNYSGSVLEVSGRY